MMSTFFLYGSLFMGVVPLGAALYNYAYLIAQHKWATCKIIFHLIIVCVSVFIRFDGPNLFLYYILCFGLAVTIYFIFIHYLKNPLLKKIATASTVIYLFLLLIDAYLLSEASSYKNVVFTLFDIWALAIIVIYLGQILQDPTVRNLRNYPMLWISIGIGTVYLAAIIHMLLSSSTLAINVKLFFLTENISLMGNVAGTLLQTIGFWKCRKTAIHDISYTDF